MGISRETTCILRSMNECDTTQEFDLVYRSEEDDSLETEKHNQMEWDKRLEEEDIIQTFLEGKVEALVKEYLAKYADDLIDLAIKTYIKRKENKKIERKNYSLKTSVRK